MTHIVNYIHKNSFVFQFVVLLLGAAIIRVFFLIAVPNSLYWDEIAMVADAQSILATGKDIHGLTGLTAIFPSYGDYKLPVYIYASLPFFALHLPVEIAIRSASLVAGVMTVALAGLIIFELTEKWPIQTRRVASLSGMFIICILPWSLVFSHNAFEGHLGQMIVGLSIYLILIAKRHPWMLIVAGLLGAIGMETYYSVRFVWPPVALGWWLFVIFSVTQRQKKVNLMICGVIMLAIFGLSWFGATKSSWYSESQQFRLGSSSILNNEERVLAQNEYRELVGDSWMDRFIFHRNILLLQEFFSNIGRHLDPTYIFLTGDQNLRHGTGAFGVGYVTMLPLLPLGLFVLWKRSKFILGLILFWWMVGLVPASVPVDVPHSLRSLNSLLPFSILLGFGLSYFFIDQNNKIVLLGKGLIAAMVISFLLFSYYYIFIYPTISMNDWQSGYKEIAQLVASDNRFAETYIDINDSRFFLWFLVYGVKNPSQYHLAEENHFMKTDFFSTHFYPPNISDLTSTEGPVLIVANDATIHQIAISHPDKVFNIQKIEAPTIQNYSRLELR